MTSVQQELMTWLTPTCVLVMVSSVMVTWVLVSWMLGWTHKNLPPGPRVWRSSYGIAIGTLTDTLPSVVIKWRQQYGPVIYARGIDRGILFLNSIDDVRALIASDEYRLLTADRAPTVITQFMYSQKDMVMNAYDAKQRKQRRLFHSVMGTVGEGAESLEKLMHDELTRMVSEIREAGGQDVQLDEVTGRALKNILYTLLFGEQPASSALVDTLVNHDRRTNTIWSAQVNLALTKCPFLWWFPNKYRRYLDNYTECKAKVTKLINDHKNSYKPGKIRGMLDVLFEAQGKPGAEWMDDESLIVYALTTLAGAHVTTFSTLQAMFMYLLHHPESVTKIQEEIDRVLGDIPPRVSDRPDMSYTEAVVLETLRLYIQEPFMNLRTTRKTFQYKGYTIPEKTLIMTNSEAVNHDPKYFEDPWTFKPERLLDSRGVLYPADHPVRRSFQPFGLGVRVCPGENFGRSRLFLFIVCLLQKFDLLAPESEPMIKEDSRACDQEVMGQVRHLPPFKVRFLLRTNKST